MKDTFSEDGLKNERGSSVLDVIKGSSSLKVEEGCFFCFVFLIVFVCLHSAVWVIKNLLPGADDFG